MRAVLLSLLAAGSLTATAFAQDAAQPAPEAQPAPAPEAQPAPPADAAAPPAADPAAPTEATSVLFNDMIKRVCMPLVKGGDIAQIAKSFGFKQNKRDMVWTKTWAQGMKVTLREQGVNKDVCSVSVQHPINGLEATITDTHNWAMYNGWTLEDNAKRTTDMERSNRKWSFVDTTTNTRQDIVLITVRKIGGAPVNAKYDQTDILYAVTKW
ncbi:hypothetical protein GVN21_02195 [Caulobacter sp. SLTY]|uniref:hypothetical protein n=1 Tax=Caulobacter sp. SLTY TaxID=2683262 RepID=UPI0014126B4E|nr:hypothetical protein [Caulobacter sp. SLTY]NBB14162.1 hypothetical protein [Caulobacter sp. SLTY]